MNLKSNYKYSVSSSRDCQTVRFRAVDAWLDLENQWKKGIYSYASPSEMESIFNEIVQRSGANKSPCLGPISKIYHDQFKPWLKENNFDIEKDDLFEAWIEFYSNTNPGRIDLATNKAFEYAAKVYLSGFAKTVGRDKNMFDDSMISNFRSSLKDYIEHLVYFQTIKGFIVEEIFLKTYSDNLNLPYRKSTLAEERMGIDGFIGDQAYSIKPKSFKDHKLSPVSGILVKYSKDKNNILFELPNLNFAA